jgi:hypothetical protein
MFRDFIGVLKRINIKPLELTDSIVAEQFVDCHTLSLSGFFSISGCANGV